MTILYIIIALLAMAGLAYGWLKFQTRRSLSRLSPQAPTLAVDGSQVCDHR